MMRSLSSAVAGLRTHQTKMDVIGNNIANVNTYGFKASRTTFQDIYYQTLGSGNAGTDQTGGTNPTQIGYGSAVATIDILNTQAGAASTERPLDVYITGDGFLVTQDPNGNFMYTRLGNMGFDSAGNLCDANGNYVMGFPYEQDANGNMVPKIGEDGTATAGELTNIRIDPGLIDELTQISISSSGEITGVLPGNAKVTLNSAAPGFINKDSLVIPESSNFVGSVNLSIYGQFTKEDMASALKSARLSGLSGAADGGLSALDFNPDFALQKPVTFTVSENPAGKAIVTMSGKYVNSKGETVSFTASAEAPDAGGTVDFKDSKGNKIFSADFPASGYSYQPNLTAVTSAALQTALQDLGIENMTGLTFTPPAGIANPNLTVSAIERADGKIVVSITGKYEMPAGNPLDLSVSGEIDPAGGTNLNVDFKQANGVVWGNASITQAASPTIVLNPKNAINNMTYQYQASVKDKGGNVHKFPTDGYGDIPPSGLFQFGDVSMTFDPTKMESFNGIIAQIGAEDGEKINIGCLVLAQFRNANGLKQAGNSSYVTSPNSGEAQFMKPGLNGLGDLKAGSLEMSNVDISKEFTDMITTQRGFQANTRIVTVSDEMLQELVNLKR